MSVLRRREFTLAFSGAAAAWPLAARAQQPAIPVIGFLSGRFPNDSAANVTAFHRGLGEVGFFEGQNVESSACRAVFQGGAKKKVRRFRR
jgi:putative ABC transport system substrate-binding protein